MVIIRGSEGGEKRVTFQPSNDYQQSEGFSTAGLTGPFTAEVIEVENDQIETKTSIIPPVEKLDLDDLRNKEDVTLSRDEVNPFDINNVNITIFNPLLNLNGTTDWSVIASNNSNEERAIYVGNALVMTLPPNSKSNLGGFNSNSDTVHLTVEEVENKDFEKQGISYVQPSTTLNLENMIAENLDSVEFTLTGNHSFTVDGLKLLLP